MKKILSLLFTASLILLFSACSQKEAGIKRPAEGLSGMVDLNKKAQEDIKNAVGQENERLNNTLKGNNMNPNQNALGDNAELTKKYSAAIIKTNQGDIKIKFSSADAPVTVGNFLKLAEEGFYDGTKFHRVIKGFMIQGGDPLSKDDAMKDRWGTGGPGYKFDDELKGTEKYPQGTLAMANSGPDTNGSQFFIVTASPGYPLPPNYTVFGTVTEGLGTALKIENVATGANDRPVEDVIIESVELLQT